MLRRWSFCHRQPSCWSRMLEPIVNVLTTEFAPTSQTLEVLSPEAESKWVLSGLQLICSDKTRVTRQPVSVGRGLESSCARPPRLSREKPGGGGKNVTSVQATSPALRDPEALHHHAYFKASDCKIRSNACKHPQDPATATRKPKPYSRRKRLRREPCLLPGRTPSRPSFRRRCISFEKQRRARVTACALSAVSWLSERLFACRL